MKERGFGIRKAKGNNVDRKGEKRRREGKEGGKGGGEMQEREKWKVKEKGADNS